MSVHGNGRSQTFQTRMRERHIILKHILYIFISLTEIQHDMLNHSKEGFVFSVSSINCLSRKHGLNLYPRDVTPVLQ